MNLDRKQKLLIPAIIIVLGVLVWQLYGMMHGGSSMPAAAKPALPARPAAATSTSAPGASPMAAPAQPQTARTAVPAVSEQDKQRLRDISQTDAEYLKLIQEYQLLQVQRRIAEDTRAIAVAKLETAKALAESVKYGGAGNMGSNMPGAGSFDNDYKLVFTGQEAGQWTATLKMNDQLMDVVAGTNLPDGYKVVAVDSDSVTLQKNDRQKVISFLGVSESQVAKQVNEPQAKQTEANALLHIIAPGQVKKKQPEAVAPVTTDVNKNQSDANAQSEQPVKPAAPAVQHENQATASAKLDKNALTAAFLGDDDKANHAPAQKTETAKSASTADAAAVKRDTKPVDDSKQEAKQGSKQQPVEQKAVSAKPVDVQKPQAKPDASAKPAANKTAVQPEAAKHTAVNTRVAGGNFTIQLMSDRSEASVKDFIKENGLTDNASYIAVRVNGQTWYTITYGKYANAAEAQAALQKLPKSARDWQPFVRKIVTSQRTARTQYNIQHKQANQTASAKLAAAVNSNQDNNQPAEVVY